MDIYIVDIKFNVKNCIYMNVENSYYQLNGIVKDELDGDFNYKIFDSISKQLVDTSHFDYKEYDESTKTITYERKHNFFNGIDLLSTYNYTLENLKPCKDPNYFIRDSAIIIINEKYIDWDKFNEIEEISKCEEYSNDIKVYNSENAPKIACEYSDVINLNISCEVTLVDLYEKKCTIIRIPTGTLITTLGIENGDYFFYKKQPESLNENNLKVNISNIITNKADYVATSNVCILSNSFIIAKKIDYQKLNNFKFDFFNDFASLFCIKEFKL